MSNFSTVATSVAATFAIACIVPTTTESCPHHPLSLTVNAMTIGDASRYPTPIVATIQECGDRGSFCPKA